MDMTTQGKLEACDGFRSEGNAFYREGQYHRAGDRYRKVISKGITSVVYSCTDQYRPALPQCSHTPWLSIRPYQPPTHVLCYMYNLLSCSVVL